MYQDGQLSPSLLSQFIPSFLLVFGKLIALPEVTEHIRKATGHRPVAVISI